MDTDADVIIGFKHYLIVPAQCFFLFVYNSLTIFDFNDIMIVKVTGVSGCHMLFFCQSHI